METAEGFSDQMFFEPPGVMDIRVRVMHICTQMLVFQGFKGPTEVFDRGCPPE